MGVEFEKKFIELSKSEIEAVTTNYHNWQRVGHEEKYQDMAEYCYSAKYEEIEEKGFSLIPSKYISFNDRDSDINFDVEMNRIKREFEEILSEEMESQKELLAAFKGLGYEIKL
jgi:type I restriction enzyme M protein